MFKHFVFGLSIASLLVVAQPSSAALDIDGTPWDLEFDGSGNPTAQGWQTFNFSSSTYTQNRKLLANPPYVQDGVDWLTSNGNPGGSVGMEPYTGLTKAAGWTFEWSLVTHNSQTQAGIFQVNDDSNMFRIDYAPNQVTLRDGMPVVAGGGSTSVAAVDMSGYVARIFRLVREAGSSTLELYIDNDFSSPAAQITPIAPYLPYADASNLNSINWGNSIWEASYDYVRLHSGATTGIPEPASLALLALGGLSLMRRRSCKA